MLGAGEISGNGAKVPIGDRDHWSPGKLWSLLEMLRNYAYQFVGFSNYIRELEQLEAESAPQARGAIAPTELARRMHALIPGISALTKWLPMPSVEAQLDRIRGLIIPPVDDSRLLQAIVSLRERMLDDLKAHLFFHVRPEHAESYENPVCFGIEVDKAFREAADDIEAAGKCLALRQGTACVFHCMRVLELGLKELGSVLGIPYAPSWESYIKQIAGKIEEKHKRKGKVWRRDESLFRDLLGDLQSIKLAWRNPTMHIVRKYAPDEAEEVFRASRRFMVRFSEYLNARRNR